MNHLSSTLTTLDDLFAWLRACDRPLSLNELYDGVRRVELSAEEWRPRLSFSADNFCFQTLFESPAFEVNLIGWHPGQFSSVHDHRGTACCVLVLEGTFTNRDYRHNSDGKLKEVSQFQLSPGEVLRREDDQIHCCGNATDSGHDLATLHFYSPPLPPLSERRYD